MTPYVDTQRYTDHVARLETERNTLTQELSTMRETKLGPWSVEQKKRLAQIKGRLCTVATHLHIGLGSFNWPDLVHLYTEAMGGIWTGHELLLTTQELQHFEGRCEKPMRYRLQLPLLVSQGLCDLPGDEEIKYMGVIGEPIRIGRVGKELFGQLKREITRTYLDDALPSEVWKMLDAGEVSAGKIYSELPEQLRQMLQLGLAPEKALACYAAVWLTTDIGFICIPREDYARAWSLACITQMSPKYRLKREYVEACLQATLSAAQQQPDIAPEQALSRRLLAWPFSGLAAGLRCLERSPDRVAIDPLGQMLREALLVP